MVIAESAMWVSSQVWRLGPVQWLTWNFLLSAGSVGQIYLAALWERFFASISTSEQTYRKTFYRFAYLILEDTIIKRTICLWLYSPFFDLGRFFSFLVLYMVGLTGRGSVRRKAATCTQDSTNRIHAQTYMPKVGFEPTIPAAKTLHTLDRAATVIGH
jgi:hypothetical protein